MKQLLFIVSITLSCLTFGQTSTAYVTPGVLRTFLDYNMEASVMTNGITPQSGLHGGKYQWGSKTPILTQIQDQNQSLNNGLPYPQWNMVLPLSGAWGVIKTANDPCPSGYRVPTKSEWDGVIANNTITFVGTSSNSVTNYTSGIMIGNNLFLPTAGQRFAYSGSLNERGSYGYYMTSSELDNINAYFFEFRQYGDGVDARTNARDKRYGGTVRCIKE